METGTSRMKRLFTGFMTLGLLLKNKIAAGDPVLNKGGKGGSAKWQSDCYFPGKQIRSHHFNAKRNGKHLRRKHRRVA
jgi:hypothetical protein